MNVKSILHKPTRNLFLAIIISFVGVFITVSIASATLITINTDDATAADWSGATLFYSDPSGDLDANCTTGDNRDDIIEVYVASGPAGENQPISIYFLVKFADTNPNNTSQGNHQVSAYLDCPDGGGSFGQDELDASVLYIPAVDETALCNGVLPNPSCTMYGESDTKGQNATSGTANYTLEWQGLYADMAAFTAPGALNCTNNNLARIKISSYKLNPAGKYACTFDETVWRDFNSPTAVRLNSLEATNQQMNILIIKSIAAIIATLLVSTLVFLKFKRITR